MRKFPQENTPKFESIKARRVAGEDAHVLARELGMTYKSFKDACVNHGIRVKPQEIEGAYLSDLEEKVLSIVLKNPVSVGEISRQVDRSSETVIKTIDSLRARGHEVILDEISHQVIIPQEPSKEFKPTEFTYFRKFYRFGLVSDTQIGSKYQQLTCLHDAYADFEKRKVDFILHAGDLTEGVGVFRGQDVEIFLHDPHGQEQVEYVSKNYPKSSIKTYVIGGQHDRVFYKYHGFNVIDAVCKERKDLISRGFFNASFKVKGIPIELQHPGGGLVYAHSYKPQKIAEGIAGHALSILRQRQTLGLELPALIVFGHWHVPMLLPCYMGIAEVTLPCFQSQTPYLQQLGKMPVVGYAVGEIYLGKDNRLASVKIEFIGMDNQIRERDY